MTLAIPTVHLNGTSRDGLLEPICKATDAIHDAIAAVAETAPNARDYYVQGPDAFQVARKQHECRMHKLADVIRELREIGEAIG